MAVRITKRCKRIGVVLLVLSVSAVALGRGFKLILLRRPKRLLGLTRKLFGRVLNPLLLWLARRLHFDQSVVYHIGRKSGREHATPLCVSETPDGFIVPAAFGPEADWLRNLRATPKAKLSHQGEVFPVTARVIDAGEALTSAGGSPGCPCWIELQVEEYVLLEPLRRS